jgi:hypothetical protein
MVSVMLMASSIIDKKLPRLVNLGEHRATDSRQRTRRKHGSPTLWRLDLSSRYFLKRSKIYILQNMKCFLPMHRPQYTTVAQSCPIETVPLMQS